MGVVLVCAAVLLATAAIPGAPPYEPTPHSSIDCANHSQPIFPRIFQNANLSCPVSGCLVAAGHGCVETKVVGVTNCKWTSLSAAQAGCGAWSACGGLSCDPSGFCVARSWDSPLHTKSGVGTVYLKTPPLCLVEANHGCEATVVNGVTQCVWSGLSAALKGCGDWPKCKGFVCGTPGYDSSWCLARDSVSLDSHPVYRNSTAYVKLKRRTKLAPAPQLKDGWTHNWDCISCATNSMLSVNFGDMGSTALSGDQGRFNLTKTWWIDEIAHHYAHAMMSGWDLGPDGSAVPETNWAAQVELAKKLKETNPKFKVLLYQAADSGASAAYSLQGGKAVVMSHPEWWQHDEHGKVVWFNKPTDQPMLNWNVQALRDWFISFPLESMNLTGRGETLFDGLFVDAGGYSPFAYGAKNITADQYNTWYEGKMKMLEAAQQKYSKLNNGMVFANGGTGYEGASNGVTWEDDAGAFGGGSFIEWFGAQEWDSKFWQSNVQTNIVQTIGAARAGFPVVLKMVPGPGMNNWTARAQSSVLPWDKSGFNDFIVDEWPNSTLPRTADGIREAMARPEILGQTIALFLIVAEPNVFFSYAWFYNLEDGHIPCPPPIQCGMPDWYPEFERPIGPPKGPAVQDGAIWTREFEHVRAYVDTTNRSACKITWLD